MKVIGRCIEFFGIMGREENRKNMLWQIADPNDGGYGYNDWNDDTLQALQAGYTVGNQPYQPFPTAD